jgi:hypothetical protein
MRRNHSANERTLSNMLVFAIMIGFCQFGCDGAADSNPGSVASDPAQLTRQHEMKAFMEKEGKNLKSKVGKK